MRTPTELLHWHLRELTSLLERFEEGHIARPIIEAKIEDLKIALRESGNAC